MNKKPAYVRVIVVASFLGGLIEKDKVYEVLRWTHAGDPIIATNRDTDLCLFKGEWEAATPVGDPPQANEPISAVFHNNDDGQGFVRFRGKTYPLSEVAEALAAFRAPRTETEEYARASAALNRDLERLSASLRDRTRNYLKAQEAAGWERCLRALAGRGGMDRNNDAEDCRRAVAREIIALNETVTELSKTLQQTRSSLYEIEAQRDALAQAARVAPVSPHGGRLVSVPFDVMVEVVEGLEQPFEPLLGLLGEPVGTKRDHALRRLSYFFAGARQKMGTVETRPQ